MDRLVGGNECAFGTANQWANYYSGKCSCICGGSGKMLTTMLFLMSLNLPSQMVRFCQISDFL